MYDLKWPFAKTLAGLGLPVVVKVSVTLDPEAQVFVATSSSVPGLVVEASTVDELLAELKFAVDELVGREQSQDSLRNAHLQIDTLLHPA